MGTKGAKVYFHLMYKVQKFDGWLQRSVAHIIPSAPCTPSPSKSWPFGLSPRTCVCNNNSKQELDSFISLCFFTFQPKGLQIMLA